MTDAERRARLRRDRMRLRKTGLGDATGDLSPAWGPEAVSLVYRLTRMSYGLAGYAWPAYRREEIPCKFVRRHRE